MKKLALVAALGLIGLVSGVANAATATSTFNVGMTLTPKCYINMVGTTPADVATTDMALTYESFQTADATDSTSFTLKCTNTLAYGIAVTADTGTLYGINYALKLGTTLAYTNVTGGGTASGSGSSTGQTYYIGASAIGGQAGTCNAGTGAVCTGATNLHTITVTY